MSGLNLPDLSSGPPDIAAIMAASMPDVQPMPVAEPAPPRHPIEPIAKFFEDNAGFAGEDLREDVLKRVALLRASNPEAVRPLGGPVTSFEQAYHQLDGNTAWVRLFPGMDFRWVFGLLYGAYYMRPGCVLSYPGEARRQVQLHPLPDWADKPAWELREIGRLKYGEYMPVPWADDLDPIPGHYVHCSLNQKGMVAFTENEAKGKADRQTEIRPGRYLARFYPDLQKTDPDKVREWASTVDGAGELLFAKTADEIEEVYTNTTEGAGSCMSKPADCYDSSVHPARIYAGPDLQVAYFKDSSGKVAARALVWPEKKAVGRIYGDLQRLKTALLAAGYAVDGWGNGHELVGARIQKVEEGGTLVCPYIDHCGYVEDDGKYLRLSDSGIPAQSTEGLIERGRYCPRLDDYVGEGEEFYYIEDRNESWSQTALDMYGFYCDRTGDYFSDNVSSYEVIVPTLWTSTRRTTETWSEGALEGAWYCDRTDQWLSDSIAGVTLANGDTVDPLWAAENCTACAISGDLYETDELVEHDDGLVHPDNIPADAETEAA